MEDFDVRRALLVSYGMRVEDQMVRYILGRLADGGGGPIAVIGGDARTGVPRREMIDPRRLANIPAPPGAAS